MLAPEQLALMHAEIDGELDAAGRAELARVLLSDPQARALREDLQRVCRALDSVPDVEPPRQLRERILAALPHSSAVRRASWSAGWRYAALIAGVVSAGAVVLETVRGPAPAPSEIAGTMGAPAGALLDTVQLTAGPIGGRVSSYRTPSALDLKFDLVSSAPVDVLVTGGGRSVRVNGLGSRVGLPARVTLPGFPADAQTVDLVFLIGGHRVGSATIRAAAKP